MSLLNKKKGTFPAGTKTIDFTTSQGQVLFYMLGEPVPSTRGVTTGVLKMGTDEKQGAFFNGSWGFINYVNKLLDTTSEKMFFGYQTWESDKNITHSIDRAVEHYSFIFDGKNNTPEVIAHKEDFIFLEMNKPGFTSQTNVMLLTQKGAVKCDFDFADATCELGVTEEGHLTMNFTSTEPLFLSNLYVL